MGEQDLEDGKWYLVSYHTLGTVYRAPAMFKKDAAAFYSYEFSGIPARHLEIVREINTE